MKKIFGIIVCLVMAMNVCGQAKINKNQIRQRALNRLKITLIAPSQFILTDYKGDRISVGQIKCDEVKAHKERISKHKYGYQSIWRGCDESGYEENIGKIQFDTISYCTETYDTYYEVEIWGDARNRMGGYEHMRQIYYVTSNYSVYEHEYNIYPKTTKVDSIVIKSDTTIWDKPFGRRFVGNINEICDTTILLTKCTYDNDYVIKSSVYDEYGFEIHLLSQLKPYFGNKYYIVNWKTKEKKYFYVDNDFLKKIFMQDDKYEEGVYLLPIRFIKETNTNNEVVAKKETKKKRKIKDNSDSMYFF